MADIANRGLRRGVDAMKLQTEQRVTVTVTDEPSFFELLERFWREKYTGPLTVHMAQGRPNVVELPGQPVRIKLGRGSS